jgi:translocon-associated protein subunit beta
MNTILTNAWIALTLLLTIAFVHSEEQRAQLVLSKEVLNHYIVELKPMSVAYYIYNIGNGVATDIELRDDNFDSADSFNLISGSSLTRWSQLAPGANVSHAMVLSALSAGYFNFTSATVSYRTTTDSRDLTIGYSSAPGERQILPLKDFNRHHSSRMVEWFYLLIITTPTVLIPFMLWYLSHRKYEGMLRLPSGGSKKNK